MQFIITNTLEPYYSEGEYRENIEWIAWMIIILEEAGREGRALGSHSDEEADGKL